MKNLSKVVFLLGFWALPSAAYAMCPVCTVAVAAGIGLSRWLGVDDTITGLWIGGLIVALIWWTINWLNKKNIRFKGRKILVVIGYLVLIILPLHFMKILWHPL